MKQWRSAAGGAAAIIKQCRQQCQARQHGNGGVPGKNFLVKELVVNSKSKLSLQKHFHRSEYWTITDGKPLITLNKKNFLKKPGEKIFIPREAIHRIENKFKKKVKIIEIQTGPILKETDIVRYQDIYGRVN